MPAINDVVSFTRASSGTYWDANGVLQVAGPDQLRLDHDPVTGEPLGVLIESEYTEKCTNNTMTGAVVGSPGALPSGWELAGQGSLVTQVVSNGEENGLPYFDLRVSGVASSNTLWLRAGSEITGVAAGQTWRVKCWIAALSGVVPSFQLNPSATGGGQAFVSRSVTDELTELEPAELLLTGSPANLRFLLRFGTIAGNSYDFTVRVAAPQIALNQPFSSIVLTTGAETTRAADQLRVPLGPWWNSGSGTLIVDGVVTAPVVDSGSLDLTASAVGSHIQKVEYTP